MMHDFPYTLKTPWFVLLILLNALWGCSHTPTPDVAQAAQKPPVDHYEVLLRESRAEADRLRSELATIKIATAKQSANLLSVQSARTALRKREDELASENQQVKAHISSLEAERDTLRRQNSELQARSASVPELRQLVLDIRALQTSVQQMVNNMQTLSTDITHIKQDMLNNQKRFGKNTPKLTTLSGPLVLPIPPNNTEWVTVAPGDTLWRISQAYGLSVKSLKAMNDLQSDFIIVGQQLRVSALNSPQSVGVPTPDAQAALDRKTAKGQSKILPTREGSIDPNEEP